MASSTATINEADECPDVRERGLKLKKSLKVYKTFRLFASQKYSLTFRRA